MKPIDHEPFYRKPDHYDAWHRNFKEDIPFYLNQIKKFSYPVLELACGTGRLTIPIASEGYQITGLDISKSMLSAARRKSKEKDLNIEWISSDCRMFKLDKKFNVIFLPFNSIAHLHDLESIDSCFSCVRDHLTKDGRFIIDIFNPHFKFLLRNPEKRYYRQPRYRLALF